MPEQLIDQNIFPWCRKHVSVLYCLRLTHLAFPSTKENCYGLLNAQALKNCIM